ncbi:MAG: hypothetical protein ACJ8AW_54125 [Rhodopila sp.]
MVNQSKHIAEDHTRLLAIGRDDRDCRLLARCQIFFVRAECGKEDSNQREDATFSGSSSADQYRIGKRFRRRRLPAGVMAIERKLGLVHRQGE